MAVKTREEILEELRVRVGEQTDDETIAFLEDVTDTLSDLETKAKGEQTGKLSTKKMTLNGVKSILSVFTVQTQKMNQKINQMTLRNQKRFLNCSQQFSNKFIKERMINYG